MFSNSEKIFRSGSKTYYNSALFFPPSIRRDVISLYAFVRVADDYVDSQPQDEIAFHAFHDSYLKAWNNGTAADNPIIDSFIELQKRRRFDPQWTAAFFRSMQMDLIKTKYETLEQTLDYIHGSAEVIGLFMARIMELPGKALLPASRLGRAMQYINFIRDIAEDLVLGRQYLPAVPGELPDLSKETALRRPQEFTAFIRQEIERYKQWQSEAETGYHYIPRRCRIPIITAAEMYRWTAAVINRNPFIVYSKKVKPGKIRILMKGVKHILTP